MSNTQLPSPPSSPPSTSPPRSHIQSSSSASPVHSGAPPFLPASTVTPLALNDFYHSIAALNEICGKAQGSYIQAPLSDTNPEDDLLALYREFLNGLAYICDFASNGGLSVTAVAIEQTAESFLMYWIAGNGDPDIQCSISNHLKDILRWLKKQELTITHENFQNLRTDLLEQCVEFSHQKIEQYYEKLIAHIPYFQRWLERNKQDSNIEYIKDLLNDFLNKLVNFITYTHKTRQSCRLLQLQNLVAHAYESRTDWRFILLKSINEQSAQDIHHFISRLGHHYEVAQTLLRTRAKLPYLFDSYGVQWIEPLLQDRPMAMVGSRPIVKKRPHIHAEVQMLEHFYVKGLKFASVHPEFSSSPFSSSSSCTPSEDEQYKFIGCSKAACYLCHLYFLHFPREYGIEVPHSHQNLYTNWLFPRRTEAEKVAEQNAIVRAMTGDVRRLWESAMGNDGFKLAARQDSFEPDEGTRHGTGLEDF